MLRRSYFLPLLALCLSTAALVSPVGDFPLNDDWVYGGMVRSFLDVGRIVPHPYAAANALVQTLWGAAFCGVFGFSFTVLRISTLVFALTAIWATARCARELGMSRGMALLCGFLLLANPLFLNLSYTFMSEVPFIALMMCSGWFYLRALRRGQSVDIAFGSVFAALSYCNRQYGLLSTIAFVGALILVMRGPLRRPQTAHVLALVGPWVIGVLVFTVLGLSPNLHLHRVGLAGHVTYARQIAIAWSFVFSVALYLGLFIIPFAVGIAGQVLARTRRWGRGQWAFFLGIGGFYVFLMLLGARPMPYLPNMLRDVGVGPLTLTDSYFMQGGWSPAALGDVAWRCITALAALAAGILAAHWLGLLFMSQPTRATRYSARSVHPIRRAQYWFLFLWGGMLLFSPINPALTVYFDRYMLPGVIPFVLLAAIGISTRPNNGRGWIMFALCVGMYAFSLVSVQDYLSCNRARWQAIEILRLKYGARDNQIDGGYEFNGMYTSEAYRALHPERPIADMGKKGWWILDDTYAVSFRPRDGYQELERIPYRSWLSSDLLNVLVLKRRD